MTFEVKTILASLVAVLVLSFSSFTSAQDLSQKPYGLIVSDILDDQNALGGLMMIDNSTAIRAVLTFQMQDGDNPDSPRNLDDVDGIMASCSA